MSRNVVFPCAWLALRIVSVGLGVSVPDTFGVREGGRGARGALEQLQGKPHRAGIGSGSRRWFRTGHSREQYHEPMSRDTVTVRCDRMGILEQVRLVVPQIEHARKSEPSVVQTPVSLASTDGPVVLCIVERLFAVYVLCVCSRAGIE